MKGRKKCGESVRRKREMWRIRRGCSVWFRISESFLCPCLVGCVKWLEKQYPKLDKSGLRIREEPLYPFGF